NVVCSFLCTRYCTYVPSFFFSFILLESTAPRDLHSFPTRRSSDLAPPLAGKGIANPMAAVLTGALMFEQLRHLEAARDLERAVQQTLAAGVRTPDLGGGARTRDVAAAIAERLS